MLYLAPWIGTGTKADPFRVKGADGFALPYTCLDLRIDPTAVAGFCLLHTQNAIVEMGVAQLAAFKDDTVGLALRTSIGNQLGVTLSANTISGLLEELLFQDLGKWKPVMASSVRKVKEVVFGMEVWASKFHDPGPSGNVDPSDDFNRADNADLGANWDVMTGETGWEILGNQANCPAVALGGVDATESWNADTLSADQFSQVTLIAFNGGGLSQGTGAAVRCSAAARTYYRFVTNDEAGVNAQIAKFVAAANTQLATQAVPTAVNDVLRVEAEGSTLRFKLNGAIKFQATDTSITSGRPGITFSSPATSSTVDDWSSGDITTTAQGDRYFPWRLQ